MVLGMGLDVSWLPMFMKLRDLKRLIWFVPEEDGRVLTDHEREETENDQDVDQHAVVIEDKHKEIVQRLEFLFRHSSQMPSVKAKILDEDGHSGVCECNACPLLYDHYLHNGRPSVYEDG